MNYSYRSVKQELFTKLNNFRYRIGLDLGVGSIGFAVVTLEGEEKIPKDLIISGSRIFTPSIGASERRMQRGARNANRHKRHRLETLWKVLSPISFMLPYTSLKDRKKFPNTADAMFSQETQKLCPYKLRIKGLSEKCSTDEIGYILYHISNHRGTSSIRSFLDAPPPSKEEMNMVDKLAKTRQHAKEKGINTYIELLYIYNQSYQVGFRNKSDRQHMLMPTRDLILKELSTLLKKQQEFHSTVITDQFIKTIEDIVNYENEKIVPESGYCPYFPEDKKLPKCHFLNEERRLWEALNNSSIEKPYSKNGVVNRIKESFSLDEKQKIFTVLREGKTVNESFLRKFFPEYKECDFVLQGKRKDSQKIEGFRFKSLENQDFWKKLTEQEQDDFLFDWVNCADDDKLISLLQEKYRLSEEKAERSLIDVKLIGDYAPIGKTALLHIIRYIKEDKSYIEAIKICEEENIFSKSEQVYFDVLPYYGQVLKNSTQPIMGKAWHSYFKPIVDSNRFIKPNTSHIEEKFGRIANPVVHQTLNELRKVINEIMSILGSKPTEIGIEVSRELKVGQEERDKTSREQNYLESENKKIFDKYCKGNGCTDKIFHFQLAEAQDFVCPYCICQFSVSDVANGDVDIDHIFPISESDDNSKNNRILAHKDCNAYKAKKTPYSAFAGTDKWKEILHHLESKPMLKKYIWRFTMDNESYREWLQHRGFLSRFSTDTSYIAKASAEYLSCLFEDQNKRNVRTIKGRETATLRKAWGLQSIAHKLGARFVEDGDVGIYQDSHKKIRLDHRHHALDAIVIAYSTNSYTKLINTLHAKGVHLSVIQEKVPFPQISSQYNDISFDDDLEKNKAYFSSYITDLVTNYSFVSIKYDHDKNGGLTKDTAYRILLEKNGILVLVTKKSITSIKESSEDLDKALLPKMYTEKKLETYTDEEKSKLIPSLKYNKKKRKAVLDNRERAEQNLKDECARLKADGKNPRDINEKLIFKKSFEITGGFYYSIENRDRSKIFVQVEPTSSTRGVAYDTDSNLCVDLYHNSEGKLCGEVIRKIYAMDKNYIPSYCKQGYSLFEKIFQGDTLEIDLFDEKKLNEKSTGLHVVSSIKCPNAPHSKTLLRVATFTELSGNSNDVRIFVQNLLKSKKSQDASFSLNSMQLYNVRRVVLSSIGLIQYRSPVLKNKE